MTVHMPIATEFSPDGPTGVPARLVALSEHRSAIFFDLEDTDLPRGARIAASIDGQPLDGPVAMTRLDRPDGTSRNVMIVASRAEALAAASTRIESAGRCVAHIDPLALQSPLVDPLALIAGLDDAGGRRLLKLLLTTGASLFGKGELGGFGRIVGRLLESVTSPVPLAAWCPVGHGAGILSWRLPANLGLPRLRDLCVLHGGRARRFTDFAPVEELSGADRVLHLLVSRPLPEDADLVILGDAPVRLAGPDRRALRTFEGWFERRSPEVRARTLDWLDGLAAGDARIAELRDELAAPAGTEPGVEVLHLSETPSGLLYLLALEDPCGLLAALRLSAAGQSEDIPCGNPAWHPAGPVVAGFAQFRGRSGGSAEIVPIYRSGRAGAVIRTDVRAFDGRTPEPFAALPEAVASAALASAIPAAMRARPVWRSRITQFGLRPQAPATALVVAAGEAPEHLHAVIASLTAERGGRNVEIVVHHADGPATAMVQATAEALAAIHRVGIRVISVAPHAFPSERLRAALAETRASAVLSLEEGCLPDGPGWLSRWRRRIGSGAGPRVVIAQVTGCSGAAPEGGDTAGLNAAAIRRLLQTRPLLPHVAADLAATPDLPLTKGLPATTYGPADGSALVRAAERIALARLVEHRRD